MSEYSYSYAEEGKKRVSGTQDEEDSAFSYPSSLITEDVEDETEWEERRGLGICNTWAPCFFTTRILMLPFVVLLVACILAWFYLRQDAFPTSTDCEKYLLASAILTTATLALLATISCLLDCAPSGDHFEGFFQVLGGVLCMFLSIVALLSLSIAGFIVYGGANCVDDKSPILVVALLILASFVVLASAFCVLLRLS